MSRRRCGSKMLHTWGPAALKFWSPKLLCVHGTRHVLAAAERSWRRSLSITSWMSSAMYAGVWPANDWCTRHATGYSTRWRTGRQCSWRSTGVIIQIWSHRRAPVTRGAAAFWMDWTFHRTPSDMPVKDRSRKSGSIEERSLTKLTRGVCLYCPGCCISLFWLIDMSLLDCEIFSF